MQYELTNALQCICEAVKTTTQNIRNIDHTIRAQSMTSKLFSDRDDLREQITTLDDMIHLYRPSDRRGNEATSAMCVQDVDDQCVLQFTLRRAVCCVLHRPASQVIHC